MFSSTHPRYIISNSTYCKCMSTCILKRKDLKINLINSPKYFNRIVKYRSEKKGRCRRRRRERFFNQINALCGAGDRDHALSSSLAAVGLPSTLRDPNVRTRPETRRKEVQSTYARRTRTHPCTHIARYSPRSGEGQGRLSRRN